MQDLTDKLFGRLTVLYKCSLKSKHIYWLCKCACGNEKSVRQDSLLMRDTQSCGCILKEGHPKSQFGISVKSYLAYNSWLSLKRRCRERNSKVSKYYGDKGIAVCDRWLNSFDNFLTDMGERPSRKHSIERINTKGNYCPENCIWATRKEQAFNTKRSIKNKSGRTGVYYYQRTNKWFASIMANGKLKSLGFFNTKQMAISAREAAEIEYYGKLKPSSLLESV